MLLGGSLIWGVAFVAQSTAMDHIGPFTLSAVRCALASLALFAAALAFDRLGLSCHRREDERRLWRAGLLLGLALFMAINLQQLGIQYTSVGKAGFITSLYIVIVPLMGLLLRRKVPRAAWLCAGMAVVGLYFLSVKEGFSIGKGDLLVLASAFAFAVQILLVDRFSGDLDCIRLACIQFFIVSVLSAPFMLLEKPSLPTLTAAWLPILYTGLVSGGVAYTFQMLGQRTMAPEAASLLMCPESVFAALAGWLLLGQTLSPREALGCALVFIAVVGSQIPWERILHRRGADSLAEKHGEQ